MSRLALASAALLAAGCASTLSTMDTAATTPVKHVHADVAMGVYVPTGPLYDLVTTGVEMGKAAKDGGNPLSPVDAEKVYTAAVAMALMPPSSMQEVMLRTGVMEDLDVGLRLATTSLRLDAKYRYFHKEEPNGVGQHASIGLGVSRFFFGGPVFDALELVKIDDFSRWDFEVPALYSLEVKEIFKFYGGAKYILTKFSCDPNLYDIQQRVSFFTGMPPLTDRIDSSMHFFGGVAGLGLGYKYVFLFGELNAGYVYARPRFFSFVDNKVKEHDVGGVTLYPSLGLVVRI